MHSLQIGTRIKRGNGMRNRNTEPESVIKRRIGSKTWNWEKHEQEAYTLQLYCFKAEPF